METFSLIIAMRIWKQEAIKCVFFYISNFRRKNQCLYLVDAPQSFIVSKLWTADWIHCADVIRLGQVMATVNIS